MHIVPKIDDGATSLEMSLDMLKMAYEQGVRNIFCTSHNGYSIEKTEKYKAQFMMLQMCAKMQFSDLNLHMGCELLCDGECMDAILFGLETGVFLSLCNTKYVLTELYSDVTPDEAEKVVANLTGAGWLPILAHFERYPDLFCGNCIEKLIESGAKIQVNLYSLQEESMSEIKNRARYLIENELAHFVGSDSHQLNHRPPKYENGIKYLYENCEKEYFEKLCFKNADEYLKLSQN
jgi:protein-tyrosine phosphatase